MENGRLIAVDTGRNVGLAFFEQGELVQAQTLRNMAPKKEEKMRIDLDFMFRSFSMFGPTNIVIENPVVYDRKRWKGNPNDLIKVANVAGMVYAIGSLYGQSRFVTPQNWKGQTEKEIDHPRTLKTLAPHEHTLARSASEHALDAIGIGLWVLKRR